MKKTRHFVASLDTRVFLTRVICIFMFFPLGRQTGMRHIQRPLLLTFLCLDDYGCRGGKVRFDEIDQYWVASCFDVDLAFTLLIDRVELKAKRGAL